MSVIFAVLEFSNKIKEKGTLEYESDDALVGVMDSGGLCALINKSAVVDDFDAIRWMVEDGLKELF